MTTTNNIVKPIKYTRAMRPASKRGMPENSLTRKPENELRAKLMLKAANE